MFLEETKEFVFDLSRLKTVARIRQRGSGVILEDRNGNRVDTMYANNPAMRETIIPLMQAITQKRFAGPRAREIATPGGRERTFQMWWREDHPDCPKKD